MVSSVPLPNTTWLVRHNKTKGAILIKIANSYTEAENQLDRKCAKI